MTHDIEQLRAFAERYTAAWCSMDPTRVAQHFAPGGSLQINDGAPAVGRAAITQAANGFYVALPDMQVYFDDLVADSDRIEYHWTFTGTNTGPGGTGKRVRVSGFEEWTMDEHGLIAASHGHYDADEYARQLERGGSPVMEPGARAYLERLTVTDVAAHTVGVSVIDPRIDDRGQPVMAPMLPRNTALPFEAECSFFTIRPSETRIVVPILEGEDSDPALCRRVGEVIVAGLPPGRPAHQQVVVTMRLDRDGILQVSATDVATGAAAATTIVHADQNRPDEDDAADRAVRSVTVE